MRKKLLFVTILMVLMASLSAIYVEVGTGTLTTSYIPVNGLWDYSWSRTIYLQADLINAMEINTISYNVSNTPNNYMMENQSYYLKHTTNASILSTEYINPATDDSYELVYSGNVTYNGGGWTDLVFNTAFNYNGTDNLEVLVINNDGDYVGGYPNFVATAASPQRAVYKYADTTFPTTAGTLSVNYPNTRFHFATENEPSMATLTAPANNSFNLAAPVELTWTNGADTDWVKVYFSANLSEVASMSPTALLADNYTQQTYTVEELESLTTYYWKIVAGNNISEYLISSPIWNFSTSAADGSIVIGNGRVVNAHLPMEPFYGYSITQSIYDQEWLDIADQRIEQVSYYSNGNSAWTENNIQIYLGHTSLDVFETTTSWIPSANLLLVYDGPLVVPALEGWVTLPLTVPFNYNNTDNLVVAFEANTQGYSGSNDEFFCTPTTGNKSIWQYSDSVNSDFINPAAGTLSANIPNILLTMGDIPTTPQLMINPEEYSWANTIINSSANTVTFTMRNTGLGTLTINSVTLDQTVDFILTDTNTYPLNITNNTAQFTVTFHPLTVGDFTANITINDAVIGNTVIPLTGTGYDAMIYDFPHFEGFEDYATGALPQDWSTVTNSTNEYAMGAVYSTAYEGIRGFRFYNSGDPAAEIFAITPPVDELTTRRIRFMARSSTTGESLIIGTAENNNGEINFTARDTIVCSADFQQYQHSFATADEDANFIALKYVGSGASYLSVYLDNFFIETIPNGPAIVITQEGLDFGDVYLNRTGVAHLNIENWGIAPLEIDFSQTGTELSFTPSEVTIPAGTSQSITVSLTPIAENDYTGSFNVLSNDPAHPSTTIVTSAFILPALPDNIAVIGTGTTINEGLPFEPWYRHSYSQSIYYAGEIGITGQRIEKIAWHYNGSTAWGPDEFKIYMGMTDATQFSSNTSWISAGEMMEVYSGTITVPATNGYVEIMLDLPFNYSNTQNLVVGVFHSAPSYHSSSDEFFCTPSTNTRSILYYADSTIPDHNAPPTANYMRNSYPNIRLEFGLIPDGPAVGIPHVSLNFGELYLNRTVTLPFTVRNLGIEDLVVNLAATGTELTFLPAGATIEPFEYAQFMVKLTPLVAGAYTGSFTVNSNDPNNPAVTITTSANILPPLPDNIAIVGVGTTVNEGLPFEPYYRHSYSQSIYYSGEIGIADQRIEKISWNYNGNSAWGPDDMKIYMGLTSETAFSGNTSWISLDTMMEVFNGTITVPATAGWLEIELDIPFIYDDAQNLVVAVFHSAPSWHSSTDEFYCTNSSATRSILYYNDSNIPNPATPPTANYMRNSFPNITLEFGEIPNAPDLTVYPTNTLFEMVPVAGTSLEKIITMRSIGLQDVTIASAPTITGPNADQFTITTDNNTYPLVLPFNQTATIGVKLTPSTEGSKSASIQIVDNARSVDAAGKSDASARFNNTSRVTHLVNLNGYAYADDGNDVPAGATTLTLPVNGQTYAIMPIGDIDWYKIPAMGIGDTLLARTADAGTVLGTSLWLYGPVDNPANIVPNVFLVSGNNLNFVLPQSGNYYLRVAKTGVNPEGVNPPHTRKGPNAETERFVRADTGLYNLFVDANYNYDFNAPLTLVAANQSGYIELTWVEPPYERYLIGYKIYRNGNLITPEMIPIGTNLYHDADVIVGTEYAYHVVGMYEDPDGFSLPSNTVTIIYYNLGTPLWGDDFEEHPDFTLDMPNWIQYDIDGGNTYGISNVEFENAGEAMSYMVFNPASTVPPITDMIPQSGDKFLTSFASTEGQNDDWIVTPRIIIGTTTVVSFYAKSYTADYGLERFRVKMSLGGSAISNFQYSLHQGMEYLEAPTEWTPYHFNVSQLTGNAARFAIQCVSEDAFVLMIDNFRIDSTDDGVDNEDVENIPQVNALSQNYPNPFNPETSISFSMKEAGNVSLDIYNIKGQKVKSLINEYKAAGSHNVVWNGTDDNSRNVASGVYFYKMRNGTFSSTKKMILMK